MITNPAMASEARKVLGVVSRALIVFGGDAEPVGLPRFAAPPAIEDDLGRGRF